MGSKAPIAKDELGNYTNWTVPAPLFSDAINDLRDPSVALGLQGRLIMNYFKSNSSGTVIGSFTRYSDDNGATWSAEDALPQPNYDYIAISAKPHLTRNKINYTKYYFITGKGLFTSLCWNFNNDHTASV